MSLKRPLYNFPVVPEQSEQFQQCKYKPLTRAEWKCDFRHTLMMKHTDSQTVWEAILTYKMASCVQLYSRYAMKAVDGRETPFWRETMKKLSDAGIYIQNIGLQSTDPDIGMYGDFLLDTFGEKYVGAKGDSEFDGQYTCGVSWGDGPFAKWGGQPQTPSPTRSKEQARKEFELALGTLYGRIKNRGISMISLGFGAHYAAECGARMLGLEAEEQNLPSDMLKWAFVRGAAKQYDRLTFAALAQLNIWGNKAYYRGGIEENQAFLEKWNGRDYGPTDGLNRREWYLAYMYGSSTIFFCWGGEFFHVGYDNQLSGDYMPFIQPGGGSNTKGWALLESNLSPTGKLYVETQEFVAEHPDRGVAYIPVAVMLDYDHGWCPPRSCYKITLQNPTGPEDEVWGNMPYSRLDYQIDNFFRWVYPDYEHAGFYRNDRGRLTNTPLGDSFDVILSNASQGCMDKYQAVVLLGDLVVEKREGLAGRLNAFMEDGGTVIAGIDQWETIFSEPGNAEKYSGKVLAADGKAFEESEFEYRKIKSSAGEVILKTAAGDPLVIRKAIGKGELYLVTVTGWGRSEKRFEFLAGVKHILGNVLSDLTLVRIEGRPVGCLVNLTDREDELIVTLTNNSPDMPWEGRVRIKDNSIQSFEAWMSHSEADIDDGALRCGVPANDIRIFKLKADRNCLSLKFKNIDWRSLGVGICDTDFQTSPYRRGSHF
jgi:hypothetical protein